MSWISTAADDVTRTVKVRVDLPNADGRLRANTFGTGRIVLREEPKAIVIPSEAIHWDGTCNVVFVRDKNFMQAGCAEDVSRTERAAGREGRCVDTEIIAGLLPGEVIASKNSVVLEAQLLKSNLGAGCACCRGKVTVARVARQRLGDGRGWLRASQATPFEDSGRATQIARPKRVRGMLNWIIDFSLRHRLLVIVGVRRPGGRGRAIRCAISISTRFRTRRPCRCRSTRWRRHWGRRKSSSGSRFRSSRRSAGCPASRGCGAFRSLGFRRSWSRSRMAPTSTSPGSWSTSGCRPSS